MQKYQRVFDTPANYPNADDCYLQGRNPGLLRYLLQYLKDKENQLTEVFLSTPVYNNPFLHHALQKLAAAGIKVTIITNPIDSYRNTQPSWITDLADQQAAFDTARTPYQLARDIFGEAYKNPADNFHLQVFPHLSVRSHEGNPFAKGRQPYSLELTSFLFLFRQGGTVAFSSSDLSCGVPVQEGHLLFEENDWKLLQNTRRFFQELEDHSFMLRDFDFNDKYNHFAITAVPLEQKLPVFFLAPFYKDSPSLAEAELVSRIKNARRNIYIISPEINCYEYEVDGHFHSRLEDELIEHFGFLRPVLEQASAGVEVKFLTGTFPHGGQGIAEPKDTKAMAEFIRIARATAHNSFATAPHIGSSFLLIDDQLILSSTPFRPDVFVYLDQVRIQGFTEAEAEGYTGVFSATGFFWLVEEKSIVDNYRQHFERLWAAAKKV